MAIKTAEPEEFRAYLEAKEPGAIVGVSRSCGTCPLATYLTAINPGLQAAVLVKWWHIGPVRGDTDQWMRDFIELVDTTELEAITRERALEALDFCL